MSENVFTRGQPNYSSDFQLGKGLNLLKERVRMSEKPGV